MKAFKQHFEFNFRKSILSIAKQENWNPFDSIPSNSIPEKVVLEIGFKSMDPNGPLVNLIPGLVR
jgi:hypothetical protein